MSTLVYRYGIAAPTDGAELVELQMRAAHEYRCALVRIERERRAEERTARSTSNAELATVEARCAGMDAACVWLAAEISSVRQVAHKRAETDAMRLGLATARAKLREAKGEMFTLRERQRAQCPDCRKAKREIVPCEHAHPEGRALCLVLDEIGLRAREKIRTAYNESPVYWGTKLVVDKAMAASRSAPLYEQDGLTPHDPKFPRWDGNGCVAVQFQGGLDVAQLFADDKRIQLTLPPWPEQHLASIERPGMALALCECTGQPIRGKCALTGKTVDAIGHKPDVVDRRCIACGLHRRGYLPPGVHPDGTVAAPSKESGAPARWVRDRAVRHGSLKLCVNTEGRGKPIWAEWRLDYARPLPPNGRALWAHVYRRMRGPHAEWSLCVTVELPPREIQAPKPGVVAIDVGWRQMPGGELRVAAWQDDAGHTGELRLSAEDLYALRESSRVQAERDVTFDRCKAVVAGWVRRSPSAPDWMREQAAHMHSWRRQGRMVAFLQRWLEGRPPAVDRPVPADEAIVLADISAWAAADRHLWATARARDVWAHRRRKDKYRNFAAQLADKYGTIVLEKFDLREVAERDEVGEDKAENETARSNRQLAAVSELRLAIVQAVASRGSEAVSVDAVDSTRTCPSCGLVGDRDQAATVVLRCECGHKWDQDRQGACPILLGRYRERPGDAKIVGGARAEAMAAEKRGKKGDVHARSKRMGKAKRERVRGAREADGNGAE
jgi:hypothetical protein